MNFDEKKDLRELVEEAKSVMKPMRLTLERTDTVGEMKNTKRIEVDTRDL